MASRTKIELDRFEVMVLFGILVLFSGLLFTFGLFVGYGMKGAPMIAEIGGHGDIEVVHEGHADAHGRTPASEVEAPTKVAGGDLRRAYQAAKQQALTDRTLKERDETDNTPKSVADAAAHLEATSEWNRRPANAEEDENAPVLESLRRSELTREKAGVPKVVSNLFERRPSAIDRFEPTPGSYTVQLGSYSTEDEAKARLVSLRKGGFNEAYYEPKVQPNGDRWYRVGVGSFPDAKWAKKAGQRIVKNQLSRDFFVRKVP